MYCLDTGVYRICQRQIIYRFAGYGTEVSNDLDHRRTEDVGKAGIKRGSDHRKLCAEQVGGVSGCIMITLPK